MKLGCVGEKGKEKGDGKGSLWLYLSRGSDLIAYLQDRSSNPKEEPGPKPLVGECLVWWRKNKDRVVKTKTVSYREIGDEAWMSGRDQSKESSPGHGSSGFYSLSKASHKEVNQSSGITRKL